MIIPSIPQNGHIEAGFRLPAQFPLENNHKKRYNLIVFLLSLNNNNIITKYNKLLFFSYTIFICLFYSKARLPHVTA
jgi:hypothetical protein